MPDSLLAAAEMPHRLAACPEQLGSPGSNSGSVCVHIGDCQAPESALGVSLVVGKRWCCLR